MKKLITITQLIIIVILSFIIIQKISSGIKIGGLRENIHNFMQSEENRRDVYAAAINLNNGNSENTCVYFVAETLRKNDYDVPKDICNTAQLISFLSEKGWDKYGEYKDLKEGDICFTTDARGNRNGMPSHTYFFMGWVKEGSYDYAYICDNQAKDYNDKVYHIRNIKVVDKINGLKKDAFSFFMRRA